MEKDSSDEERLAVEISLLESMYPDQIHYHHHAREVSYKSAQGSLTLRLPENYLSDDDPLAVPEVVLARAGGHGDVREVLRQNILEQCSGGEEVLDAIILAFEDIAEASITQQRCGREGRHGDRSTTAIDPVRSATVVVYLHHLLNTNKRKQCSAPPSTVSGVTKPGYPGVLVFSGPFQAVHDHVGELKALNWQAFQVRMETEEEWSFKHGRGVVEVESMGDVVKEVEDGAGAGGDEATGKRRKKEFLEAMKMKG